MKNIKNSTQAMLEDLNDVIRCYFGSVFSDSCALISTQQNAAQCCLTTFQRSKDHLTDTYTRAGEKETEAEIQIKRRKDRETERDREREICLL